jgi:hypothetical protein
MKKISKIIASILVILILSLAGSKTYAQAPGGVPDDPSLNNSNGAVGHPGAGATLAGGLYILLLLGGVYGSYKVYEIKQKKEELVEKE